MTQFDFDFNNAEAQQNDNAEMLQHMQAAAQQIEDGRPPAEQIQDGAENENAGQGKEISIINFDRFVVTEDQFINKPPPRIDLVEDVLPMGVVSLLAGAGAIGKSNMLLDLAIKTASDVDGIDFNTSDFFGHKLKTRGPVIYVTAEDSKNEIDRRLYALGNGRKFPNYPLIVAPLLGVKDSLPMIRPCPNGIDKTLSFVEFENYIQKLKPVLIIIDPLAAFSDVDLNKPEFAGPTIQCFVDIATDSGAHCVVTHHFNKSKDEIKTPFQARTAIRGTTTIVDRVRAAIALWPIFSKPAKDSENKDTIYNQNVVQGCLCKANFRGDTNIKTFVRNAATGLLEYSGEAKFDLKFTEDDLAQLVDDIRNAAIGGQPYTLTSKSTGLYAERHRLSGNLKKFERQTLECMGSMLLQSGRIVSCIAKGSRSKNILDIPTGDFAKGIGEIKTGAMEAEKNRSRVPDGVPGTLGNENSDISQAEEKNSE